MWIEIADHKQCHAAMHESLPAWGVWIEISDQPIRYMGVVVAPRMGSVD